MKAKPPIVGQLYGDWEVIRADGKGRWYCRCRCGAFRWLARQSLVYESRRAVCKHRSDADSLAVKHLRRLQLKAYSIRRRCGQPGRYADVQLYQPWAASLDEFIAYLLTLEGWDDVRLTLDRIDPWGGYEPGNLRFATAKVQRMNQRRQVLQRSMCDPRLKGEHNIKE